MLRAAVVRVYSPQAKTRRTRDDLGAPRRGRSRRDAAPVTANLDPDQYVELGTGSSHRRTEMPNVGRIVDQHADRRFACERREAFELCRADDLVGDEHVADSGFDKGLGFIDLLAANARGAALDLLVRDVGTLLRFRVRAKCDSGAARRIGHEIEIALERVEIDDKRGRIDAVDSIADARGDSLHDASYREKRRQTMRRRARAAHPFPLTQGVASPLAPGPPHH